MISDNEIFKYWNEKNIVEQKENHWKEGYFDRDGKSGAHNRSAKIYKSIFKKGDKVLEVGCGTGIWFEALKDTGLEYTGIDFSKEMIKKCKEKFPKNKDRFFVMSGYDLDFENHSFDYILINDVVKHVNEPKKIMCEALRVAKKSVFVTNTLSKDNVGDYREIKIDKKENFEKLIPNTFECKDLDGEGKVPEYEVVYRGYLYIIEAEEPEQKRMKILVLNHRDINEIKKGGTSVRTSKVVKYFSKKHDVRYRNEFTEEDEKWCDCIYVIHFQVAYNNFDKLMKTKKPIYYELHSFWAAEPGANTKLLKYEHEIIRKSTATFAFSTQLKDYYVKCGVDKNKIHVTLPGFDIDDYEFIVVYVGSFHTWQGLDMLYETAKKLPEISFILIGEKQGECPELLNIEYTGYKTGKELYRYYKMADVLIEPRRNIQPCQTMAGKFGDFMMYGKEKILATDVCDNHLFVQTVNPDTESIVKYLRNKYTGSKNIRRTSKFNNTNIMNKILRVIGK